MQNFNPKSKNSDNCPIRALSAKKWREKFRLILKNKANFRKGKMTLSQYRQWLTEILANESSEKTKPNKANLLAFGRKY
jgi:hypothetical protein